MKTILTVLSAILMATSALASENAPYAGLEARDIATLSDKDVDDLLAGRGWGFALAAELNGYPGPAHVLELADELALTDSQQAEVQAIFDAMNARARALGAEYVAAEAAVSRAFGTGEVDAETLAVLIAASGAIEADLRRVHLEAHLQVKPLMTRHQTMLYNRARGYDDASGGHGGGGHSHD